MNTERPMSFLTEFSVFAVKGMVGTVSFSRELYLTSLKCPLPMLETISTLNGKLVFFSLKNTISTQNTAKLSGQYCTTYGIDIQNLNQKYF